MCSRCQRYEDGPDSDLGVEFTVVVQTARDLISNSCAVLLVSGGSLEARYWWTETAGALSNPVLPPATPELMEALAHGGEGAVQRKAVVQFLARASGSLSEPFSNSFLLFVRPIRKCTVVIAFGFPAGHAPGAAFPLDVTERLNLAAFAAWSARQLDRMQAELKAANERLAGIKLVERAKAMLQSELQMDEQRAYEHLRRTSRQRRIPIPTLAQELLSRAPNAPGKRNITD